MRGAMASAADSPRRQLPWTKSIRRWSRGPTLCKLFRKAKTSFRCKLAIAKLLRQAASSSDPPSSSSTASPAPAQPSDHPLPLPPISMHRSTSLSSRGPSVLVGAIAMANCLRRHSDAIPLPGMRVNPPSRFSLDSGHPYFTTAHLNNEEKQEEELIHMVPNINRLGSSKPAPTTSRPNHTSPDILSIGSPLVLKVKDTCVQLSHAAASRCSSGGHHPLDLFIGNPFLTRVNPAPVSSVLPNNDNLVAPSFGLLNHGMKAKNCDLKDRIVFFV